MVLLLSVNVNGLRNSKKRQNIFNWFDNQHADIIMIQETHCENLQAEQEWVSDWKGNSYWSHGTSSSKGVAFLVHNQTNFKILSHEIHEDGRLTAITTKVNDQIIKVFNIYAPNNSIDRKRFIKKLSGLLDARYLHILAGDFNCVLNGVLDRKPACNTKDQGYNEIAEMINQSQLKDIFRKQFPSKQSFTFSRGQSKSRIDFILTSYLLDRSIKTANIVHFPFSDHDAVTLNLDISQNS